MRGWGGDDCDDDMMTPEAGAVHLTYPDLDLSYLLSNKGSANQEMAELINNKQWPSYQVTALTNFV